VFADQPRWCPVQVRDPQHRADMDALLNHPWVVQHSRGRAAALHLRGRAATQLEVTDTAGGPGSLTMAATDGGVAVGAGQRLGSLGSLAKAGTSNEAGAHNSCPQVPHLHTQVGRVVKACAGVVCSSLTNGRPAHPGHVLMQPDGALHPARCRCQHHPACCSRQPQRLALALITACTPH
jgi:hypothetical protein